MYGAKYYDKMYFTQTKIPQAYDFFISYSCNWGKERTSKMDINAMNFQVKKAAENDENVLTKILVLFVLEGEMSLTYQDEKYLMKEEDIILINPGVSFEITNVKKAMYGEATFSIGLTGSLFQNKSIIFYCNSVVDESHSYQDLRDILFQLTAEYTSQSHLTCCYMDSLMLRLLDCLAENYQISEKNMAAYETENDARMREIMQYVMANLDQEISLNELADKMFVSTSTLSRIFKKNTGVYFADYVMELRVKNALALLKYSEQNITQIAMTSGFSSSASFNRAFKKIIGVTPTEYREKNHRENANHNEAKAEENAIREELKKKGFEVGKQEKRTQIVIDMKKNPGIKYKKPWNTMINIGPIWDLGKANVQFHTLQLSEQLHFKYVRIWNVFSKKMMLNDGKTIGQYNYDSVNQVFDFLVQNGLKPFIDMGRRPDTALRSDGKQVYYEEQYIPFASKKSWQCMMDDFLNHIVEHYGQEEVSQWIFELDRDCIHDDGGVRLYQDDKYDFMDAWEYLYRSVKKHIPGAKFGGVSSIVIKDWKFLVNFYSQCAKKNLRPDFASFIVFPYDAYNSEEGFTTRKISQDRYSEENQIREIEKLLNQANMSDVPIYITEWNNTISNRNYLNDSCFRAAYIVKKLEKLSDSAEMIGIMAGSDWVSSHMDTVGIVNGGIGLLTKDSIRKPAYFAIDFLNQLGEYLIDKDENYIATRKENGDIYILCFYYSWFKRSYFLQDEDVDLRKCNSMVFEDEKAICLDFHFANLAKTGEYYIKKRTLNRQNGSILNEWGKFQFDLRLTRQDVKYLQGISTPTLSQRKVEVQNKENSLDMNIVLEPHEISLIHIFSR